MTLYYLLKLPLSLLRGDVLLGLSWMTGAGWVDSDVKNPEGVRGRAVLRFDLLFFSAFKYRSSLGIVVSWGAFSFLIVCVSYGLLDFLRFCAPLGPFTLTLRVLLLWGVVPWGVVCLGVTGFLPSLYVGSVFGNP